MGQSLSAPKAITTGSESARSCVLYCTQEGPWNELVAPPAVRRPPSVVEQQRIERAAAAAPARHSTPPGSTAGRPARRLSPPLSPACHCHVINMSPAAGGDLVTRSLRRPRPDAVYQVSART